ncbi:hypothetical protein MHY87_13360 [Microvirga sp. ACRRW]|uniref:hypothetical protein n=1 Tax=Microvirga sp. ACRRW TaxID=2918205 RepID=UPI001EF74338|nr:hypothetical protein [Microvirga sp. ACRRW]MCG7393893.1 hypothetical protein [Microvirga sp. ACRRW]
MATSDSAQPTASRPGMAFIRIIAILWALFSFAVGFLNMFQLGMMGFPDGYRSPYARDIEWIAEILILACYAQGLYFLVIGFRPRNTTGAKLGMSALAALVLIMLPLRLVWTCPQSAACTFAYEAVFRKAMDHGQGG